MSAETSNAENLPTGVRRQVPDDVRAAVERMCTPLDVSVLSGATAAADAHSMRLIREYVLGVDEAEGVPVEVGSAVPGVPQDRYTEIVDKHLRGVLPRDSDLLPVIREAARAMLAECFAELLSGPGTGNWIAVQDQLPEEGVEVHTWTQSPRREGDCLDTDWLEEGFFAENKGPVDFWQPKYPKTVKYPVTGKN